MLHPLLPPTLCFSPVCCTPYAAALSSINPLPSRRLAALPTLPAQVFVIADFSRDVPHSKQLAEDAGAYLVAAGKVVMAGGGAAVCARRTGAACGHVQALIRVHAYVLMRVHVCMDAWMHVWVCASVARVSPQDRAPPMPCLLQRRVHHPRAQHVLPCLAALLLHPCTHMRMPVLWLPLLPPWAHLCTPSLLPLPHTPRGRSPGGPPQLSHPPLSFLRHLCLHTPGLIRSD